MYFYPFLALMFVGNCLLSSATHTKIHEMCKDKCGYHYYKVTAIPDCYAGKITCLCWSDCHNYNVTKAPATYVYQMSDGKVCYRGCEADATVVILERENGKAYPCNSLYLDPYTGEVLRQSTCIPDDHTCKIASGGGMCNKGVCEVDVQGETSTPEAQADAQEISVVDIEEADWKIQQMCEKKCGRDSCKVTVVMNCRRGEITCRCWSDLYKYTETTTSAPNFYGMSDGVVCYHRMPVNSILVIDDRQRGTCAKNPWLQLIVVSEDLRLDREVSCV